MVVLVTARAYKALALSPYLDSHYYYVSASDPATAQVPKDKPQSQVCEPYKF